LAAPLSPPLADAPSFEAPASRLPGFTVIRPGRASQGRLLRVIHDTVYRYSTPVERSSHLYRLRPVHDLQQEIVEHELSISVNGLRRDYEDVFGNQATSLEIGSPYTELRIEARSLLRLFNEPSPHLLSPSRRVTLPLVWMPWQRQMMLPYLLPPELPETQLTELYEYAMSFVERQDSDLVQTLLDMNLTIYRDYSYVSGSTDLGTTPFDVYCSRHGVCQDFANLMICLARLLGIPARYRVGYIYTGARYTNQIQSEASHAWLEVYLPRVGWQGFDPTNGCLVHQDHIRIASGRNYRDATPTSGTLYKGGQGETLSVLVRVEDPAGLLVGPPSGDVGPPGRHPSSPASPASTDVGGARGSVRHKKEMGRVRHCSPDPSSSAPWRGATRTMPPVASRTPEPGQGAKPLNPPAPGRGKPPQKGCPARVEATFPSRLEAHRRHHASSPQPPR
ncbi:MAG: hypothetical protein EOO74_03135, partial [Myxococcales bacterium]